MKMCLRRGARLSAVVATLAVLPLCADAANNAAKKKPNAANCDKVTAVDAAQNTVTIFDHIKKEDVTYAVTTNTEIFVLHAKVGLDKLTPGMKVTVTADADPKVAARIDGVDVPPRQPKKKK